MARFGEGLVLVDIRERLALTQHLLQTEQMAVDALPVRGPRSILQMPRDGLPEQRGTLLILCEPVASVR